MDRSSGFILKHLRGGKGENEGAIGTCIGLEGRDSFVNCSPKSKRNDLGSKEDGWLRKGGAKLGYLLDNLKSKGPKVGIALVRGRESLLGKPFKGHKGEPPSSGLHAKR